MVAIRFKNGSIKEFRSLKGADLQEASLWRADLREANLRETSLRWADLSFSDLRNADLGDTDLRDTDLRCANLTRADLRGVNLRLSDLREADLREADLREADLEGACLRGAALLGADLRKTKGIKSFEGSRHLGVAFVFEDQKWIKIGCMSLEVETWVRDYAQIGEDENYTENQIEKYGEFIKQINEMSVEELKKHIN